MLWQTVTLIHSRMIADDLKSLVFRSDPKISFLAGQHFDIRLTAPNGYQAQRSYSVLNSPNSDGLIEFGIQILENGEVSPYLYSLEPGDQVEIKGPIGSHFVWEPSNTNPIVLIGGGSGLVPLTSIYSHHQLLAHPSKILFYASTKTPEKILSYDTMKSNLIIRTTSTEGHVDKDFFKNITNLESPHIYICGPTGFVETVSTILTQDLKIDPILIKTERFG